MKIAVILCVFSAALAARKIDPEVHKNLKISATTDVLVSFKNSNLPKVRSQFLKRSFGNRNERLNSFYQTLKAHAHETQVNLLTLLQREPEFESVEYHELWISNQLILRNASKKMIDILEKSDEVQRVENDFIIPLEKPLDEGSCRSNNNASLQWGIEKIQAQKLWEQGYRGQGIVVSNVDTGVRVSHRALKDNHRREFGWYDPYDNTSTRNDSQGHGTHTMGTLAGRENGIGVAPDAQWIACKGCKSNGCSGSALLLCGQWTVCLTNKAGERNCSMAPHISSNSWGGRGGRDFYDDVLKAYKAVDIVVVFSIGNSGPSCKSTGYPGESPLVIGVGATSRDDSVTDFSSRGPPSYGNSTFKPDVAAPGNRVCSAGFQSDGGYRILSGTSMACPHVAGLSALLLSKQPNLSVDELTQLIVAGAEPTKAAGKVCAGVSDDMFPNHQAGSGRVSSSVSSHQEA